MKKSLFIQNRKVKKLKKISSFAFLFIVLFLIFSSKVMAEGELVPDPLPIPTPVPGGLEKQTPYLVASDRIKSGDRYNFHISTFTLNAKLYYDGEPLTYYYGTSLDKISSTTPPTINIEAKETTYYIKSCTGAGLCSNVSSYLVKFGEEGATPNPSESTTPEENNVNYVTSTEEIENP